jgi:hypothetical protein
MPVMNPSSLKKNVGEKIQSVEKTTFRLKTYSASRNNVAKKLSKYA